MGWGCGGPAGGRGRAGGGACSQRAGRVCGTLGGPSPQWLGLLPRPAVDRIRDWAGPCGRVPFLGGRATMGGAKVGEVFPRRRSHGGAGARWAGLLSRQQGPGGWVGGARGGRGSAGRSSFPGGWSGLGPCPGGGAGRGGGSRWEGLTRGHQQSQAEGQRGAHQHAHLRGPAPHVAHRQVHHHLGGQLHRPEDQLRLVHGQPEPRQVQSEAIVREVHSEPARTSSSPQGPRPPLCPLCSGTLAFYRDDPRDLSEPAAWTLPAPTSPLSLGCARARGP